MNSTNATITNITSSSSGTANQSQLYSNVNTNIRINSIPYNQQPYNSWTVIGSTPDDNIQPITVELKTIDGKRHIVRLVRDVSLDDIEERVIITRRFSFKFPFIVTEKKTYVHFKMNEYYSKVNDNKDKSKEFDVDCNLNAFCKLIGLSYRGFSEALLEDIIENG